MNLLCISNGHGEDAIALRILSALRQQNPDVNLAALPISGAGHAYEQADIRVIAQAKTLPSGGFLNRDLSQLVRDLGGGLVGLTVSQLSAIKTWAKTSAAGSSHILAVGDIVPLLFAYYSGLPYSFLGTAKSEYWLRDESGKHPPSQLWNRLEGWSGSVYLPWERWLMSRRRCRNIFVRDQLSATHLSKLGLPAQYAGNPMMDGLSPSGRLPTLENKNPPALTILLLPGSRPPEAYENWNRIVATLPGLMNAFPDRSLVLLGAIAPNLSQQTLLSSLPAEWTANNHQPGNQYKNATLILSSAYNDCLHKADIAIATAGTATEQFVGLGKPAITLPGNGPQFTKAFAIVQAKMLGPSIQIVEDVDAVGSAIARTLNNSQRLQQIRQNGKHRMGEPGASKRIAAKLLETMNDE
ncbi:MAG: lipid-A-disaccharide synthase-related protein [Phormidesmis sp.]